MINEQINGLKSIYKRWLFLRVKQESSSFFFFLGFTKCNGKFSNRKRKLFPSARVIVSSLYILWMRSSTINISQKTHQYFKQLLVNVLNDHSLRSELYLDICENELKLKRIFSPHWFDQKGASSALEWVSCSLNRRETWAFLGFHLWRVWRKATWSSPHSFFLLSSSMSDHPQLKPNLSFFRFGRFYLPPSRPLSI